MKDFIKGVLIFICFLAIVVGIAYLASSAQKHINDSIYNDGVCTSCGGHYEFVSASRYKQTTYYYYQCDNCEKIIELKH